MKHTCISLCFFVVILAFTSLFADERIGVDLYINNSDSPAHFALDTGAEATAMFRGAAERFGLKIRPVERRSLNPGDTHFDYVDDCPVRSGAKTQKIKMGVIDDPVTGALDIDGILSWNDLVTNDNGLILIDLEKRAVSTQVPSPADIENWKKWKIVPGTPVLTIEDQTGEKIIVDTGNDGGVFLNEEKWKRWSSERGTQPGTIEARQSTYKGIVVAQVFRTKKIAVGDLILNDVPVTASDVPSENIKYKGYDAIIGLFALHQMKILIDRQNGVLYTLPVSDVRVRVGYEYNRLGAVFTPSDPAKSVYLTAHVAVGSPAYKAGVRDGDALEKVDDLDITKWRTDPSVFPLSRFWSRPVGTDLHLFLLRNGDLLNLVVKLQDPPALN